jgi:hypothetical protein
VLYERRDEILTKSDPVGGLIQPASSSTVASASPSGSTSSSASISS